MDFGRVSNVDAVDFSFPDDHPSTTVLLKTLTKSAAPKVYIGCAKWGRPDWVGKLYPKGTRQSDFLAHYVQHFNSIELNATFYRLFPKNTIEKWAATANDGFKFCPKFSQVITHIKRLQNVKSETDAMLDAYLAFGDKLGPSFIQLDDRFSPKFAPRVQAYLQSLPRDFDTAIEFRHPDWSLDIPEVTDTYTLMKELGISSVLTDTAGRRDVLHMRLTTPKVFIRFVGNSLHPSDYHRVNDWISRLQMWMQQGVHEVYFFIHQHDELYSPELSSYMIEKINQQSGLSLKAPALLNRPQNPMLF